MNSTWDFLAQKRKEQIESGLDVTFNEYFIPYYRKLLARSKPRKVIDIGCGTGHLLLHIKDQAKTLIGIDPSEGMIKVAKQVLNGTDIVLFQERVQEFHTEMRFDFAISHLCLQALEDARSFFEAVGGIMERKGSFIFLIPHPCFWNSLTHFIPEESYSYLEQCFSLGNLTVQGDIVGSVPYFHRPLRDYFQYAIQCGFRIESFDELHPDQSLGRQLFENWKVPRYVIFQCVYQADGEAKNETK